jgi:hypothetical protein
MQMNAIVTGVDHREKQPDAKIGQNTAIEGSRNARYSGFDTAYWEKAH